MERSLRDGARPLPTINCDRKRVAKLQLTTFLAYMKQGIAVPADSAYQRYMTQLSFEARKITAMLNNHYHDAAEIRALFSQLTGQELDEGFGLFPPFYTDCGKHIQVGKNVFINAGCHFQDQGGITIGDGALIGHNVVLATLNHHFAPERRREVIPSPIVIGKGVWIGSNATILPGVTVGDHAIVAAGAVVTRDIPPDVVAGGNPARIIKSIYENRMPTV